MAHINKLRESLQRSDGAGRENAHALSERLVPGSDFSYILRTNNVALLDGTVVRLGGSLSPVSIDSTGSHFLRKQNPLMSGKLALNLRFLQLEAGLDSACLSSTYAMCHLYNALQQLGYLDEKREALDTIIPRHIKSIFVGELRKDNARQMISRMMIANDLSPEMICYQNTGEDAKNRQIDYEKLSKKLTKKTGKLELPPMMAIVSDHIYDRDSLRRTLLRLGTEMASQMAQTATKVPGAKRTPTTKSFLDTGNPVDYLDEVLTHVCAFEPYFATDYKIVCWFVNGYQSGCSFSCLFTVLLGQL
jgi:hypothetical protein